MVFQMLENSLCKLTWHPTGKPFLIFKDNSDFLAIIARNFVAPLDK